MTNSFPAFAAECERRGINARECSPTHWQAIGAKLVNFYPTTGTIFPDRGTTIRETVMDGRSGLRAVLIAAGELHADQDAADDEAHAHLYRAACAALPEALAFMPRYLREAAPKFDGADRLTLRFSIGDEIARRSTFKNFDAVQAAYAAALGRPIQLEVE